MTSKHPVHLSQPQVQFISLGLNVFLEIEFFVKEHPEVPGGIFSRDVLSIYCEWEESMSAEGKVHVH